MSPTQIPSSLAHIRSCRKSQLLSALATTDVSADSDLLDIHSHILSQLEALSAERRQVTDKLNDAQRTHSAEEGTVQHMRLRLDSEVARIEGIIA